MVIQPFSPPMQPSDYLPQYSSVGYIPSQASTLKRKRDYDDCAGDTAAVDIYHNNKRHQVDIRPLTPTSPPSYLSSIQSLSPSSQDSKDLYQPTKQEISAPSLNSQSNHPIPSDGQLIPSHNLFLRDIHMKSRNYIEHQRQTSDRDEEMHEMWEEEEEMVAERYAAMNKLLGSRKTQW
jgi:hypothetical protein